MNNLPQTIWKLEHPPSDIVHKISDAFNIPLFVSAAIVHRGYTELSQVENFLSPCLENLYDPFLLDDMDKAVERVKQALMNQEKILICGDYDVDGITSVAMLMMSLPTMGAEVIPYLPNRLSDGYGFHIPSVDYALAKGCSLLITVDCGITSREAVVYARENGIDTIITDHHEPNGPLPEAYAIINPKIEGSHYPDENLAGIGVAFKFVQALIRKELLSFPLNPLLELVALGTIADVAQLTGENRILVHFGLEALAHTSHPGLKALMRVSRIVHGRKLEPTAVGFQLGPRINAVGRLGTPYQALKLLLAKTDEDATVLARELNNLNHQRQVIEEKIMQSAIQQIETKNLDKQSFIVVSGQDWHEGVIGIVASKITERFHKPTCIISIKNGVGKGSGRSIPCFSLFDCLQEVKPLLLEFGGHQIAAGFQIKQENIPLFQQQCVQIADANLSESDFIPKTYVDAELDITDVTFTSIKSIDRLAPFGLGNPKPKFLIRELTKKFVPRQVGQEGNHVKMVLSNKHRNVDAIGFNFGKMIDEIRAASSLDVIATPEINVWNGREIIQLYIHDIRPNP